jgi:hypothetical protein
MKIAARSTILFLLAFALILISACAPIVAQGAKEIDTRPQMTPTSAPLPTQEPVTTDAPWKSFTSDQYGYTVSYPADWTAKVDTSTPVGAGKSPENVTFAPSAGGLPNITIYALTGLPPFTGYEDCKPTLVFHGLDVCQVSIPAGQIPAADLNIFHNGDQFFQIGLQYESQEARAIFDLFMRSLQFKTVYNGPVTPVLKTYASKEYGYRVNYPAAWIVKEEISADKNENITFTPVEKGDLVDITIFTAKITPFSTFLACETNFTFHNLKACRTTRPGEGNLTIEQLIFEKGDNRYEITMQHTGASAMEALDNFVTSFEFFK